MFLVKLLLLTPNKSWQIEGSLDECLQTLLFVLKKYCKHDKIFMNLWHDNRWAAQFRNKTMLQMQNKIKVQVFYVVNHMQSITQKKSCVYGYAIYSTSVQVQA